MLLIALVLPVASTMNIMDHEISTTSILVETNAPLIQSTNVDWWPMFHHDPQHSGFSSSTAPNTKKILWTFKSKNEFGFYASATVVDGRVYTATLGVNGMFPGVTKMFKHNCSGKVYCLDADTGAIIWQYTSRFGAYATPAVVGGKVFVCSGCWYYQGDNVTYDMGGDVYCLDATNGSLLWEYRDCGLTMGGPIVVDGKLYFGSINSSFHGWGVWCFNTSTGQKLWKYPCLSSTPEGPLAVADGKIYVSNEGSSDKFVCLNASTGELIWKWNEGNAEEIMAGSSVANGKVYVATEGYGEIIGNKTIWYPGDLHCLDAETGHFLWQANLNSTFDWCTPAVAYGNVYVGSGMGQILNPPKEEGRGNFYCVNATTGHLVWKRTGLFPEKKLYLLSSGCLSPSVADGKVYFGCDAFFGPSFFCLNAFTGKTLWTYNQYHPFMSKNFCTSPAIADGKVFVGSLGPFGKLICFG